MTNITPSWGEQPSNPLLPAGALAGERVVHKHDPLEIHESRAVSPYARRATGSRLPLPAQKAAPVPDSRASSALARVDQRLGARVVMFTPAHEQSSERLQVVYRSLEPARAADSA
jgi:hypothetical protein